MTETYTKVDANTLRITRTVTQSEDTSVLALRVAREKKAAQIVKVTAQYNENLALLQSQLAAIDARIAEAAKLGVVERTALG